MAGRSGENMWGQLGCKPECGEVQPLFEVNTHYHGLTQGGTGEMESVSNKIQFDEGSCDKINNLGDT